MEQKNETINAPNVDRMDYATIKKLFDEKIANLSQASKQSSLSERVADLEFKVGRLWQLLTEETPTKKLKLSQTGRVFAGKIGETANK
jgi:hypothetical protein